MLNFFFKIAADCKKIVISVSLVWCNTITLKHDTPKILEGIYSNWERAFIIRVGAIASVNSSVHFLDFVLTVWQSCTHPCVSTNLLSSVMSSAVQGIPRVMSDSELTTGFTKASPVVIPDKMPMTTLNLDLDREGRTSQDNTLRYNLNLNEKHCETEKVW